MSAVWTHVWLHVHTDSLPNFKQCKDSDPVVSILFYSDRCLYSQYDAAAQAGTETLSYWFSEGLYS